MLLGLAYDILLGVPLTIGKQIVSGLRDNIDRERLITEESIKERLQTLQLQLQDGLLSESEYEGLELQLIKRLKQVREYNAARE